MVGGPKQGGSEGPLCGELKQGVWGTCPKPPEAHGSHEMHSKLSKTLFYFVTRMGHPRVPSAAIVSLSHLAGPQRRAPGTHGPGLLSSSYCCFTSFPPHLLSSPQSDSPPLRFLSPFPNILKPGSTAAMAGERLPSWSVCPWENVMDGWTDGITDSRAYRSS